MKNFIELKGKMTYRSHFGTGEVGEITEPYHEGRYEIGRTEKGELILIHEDFGIRTDAGALWCVAGLCCSDGTTNVSFTSEAGETITEERVRDGVWSILGQKEAIGESKYWAFKISYAKDHMKD